MDSHSRDKIVGPGYIRLHVHALDLLHVHLEVGVVVPLGVEAHSQITEHKVPYCRSLQGLD